MVWQGFGFLGGVVIPALIYGLVSSITGISNQSDVWIITSLPAAIAVFAFGTYLHKNDKGKVYIDTETGQPVAMKPKHTIMFVSLRVWSLVFVVIGILAAIAIL